MNSLLGFDSKRYTSGFNESEYMVNIPTINSILVNIYIISGSYVNGSTQPKIYSFFPDVSPRYKIIEILVISLPSNNCRHDSQHHHLANRSEWKRA